MRQLDLERGDMVIAVRHLDPNGANVRKGTFGVVFERANHYSDGGGPMVRWANMGVCNVYSGDVARISNINQEILDPETGELKVTNIRFFDD